MLIRKIDRQTKEEAGEPPINSIFSFVHVPGTEKLFARLSSKCKTLIGFVDFSMWKIFSMIALRGDQMNGCGYCYIRTPSIGSSHSQRAHNQQFALET